MDRMSALTVKENRPIQGISLQAKEYIYCCDPQASEVVKSKTLFVKTLFMWRINVIQCVRRRSLICYTRR